MLDTLSIIAVRVEFEPDNIRNTSGDGTFEFGESTAYNIGPTPHDRIYFERHLDYARNHFLKASDSLLYIRYRVFPEINDAVLRLSSRMDRYSPANADREEKSDSLMAFVRDVFRLLEQDADFNTYYQSDIARNSPSYRTVLAIFHAGATSLTDGAVTGDSDSPSDISSSFVSQRDFVNHSDIISNSNHLGIEKVMIFPERATQDMAEFVSANVERIEFGISGIIVHQIYRALGLPVLYNTEQGTTVAGRFSPLDFGGYINEISLGVVPIMPGAWERYFLGWITNLRQLETFGEPVFLSRGDILKIPYSSNEFFLVEFREKAPMSRVDVFTRDRGVVSATITDSTFLQNHRTGDIEGIITGVDNYDFLNPATGLVIWYVNDRIIRNGIGENRVNVGENGVYGVRVFEADLDFSIGYEGFADAFGRAVFDYGSQSDMLRVGESVRLSGFEDMQIPYSVFFRSVGENGAEIVVENTLFSYVSKPQNYDSLVFFPKHFDTIANVGTYNLQAFREDSNTIKIVNLEDETAGYIELENGVRQFAFLHSLNSRDPAVAVLDTEGNLALYSLMGNRIPVNGVINEKIKYFVVGYKDNKSVIMTVGENSSFDIRRADFSPIKTIRQFYRISRQESNFPIYIPTTDSIGFSQTNMFSSYNDSVVVRVNLSNYIDGIAGIEGVFSASGNDSLIFKDGVHFFLHPNPVRKFMGEVQAHFYSSYSASEISEAEIEIYTFSGRLVKRIENISPVRGWNRVDINIDTVAEDAYIVVLKLKIGGREVVRRFRLAITG